jgi:hypothetical protein
MERAGVINLDLMDCHLVITYVATTFIWIYQQVSVWVQMVDKSLFKNFFEEDVKYPQIDTGMVDELSAQMNIMLNEIELELNEDKLKNMRYCVQFLDTFVAFIKNMNKFSKTTGKIDFIGIFDQTCEISSKIGFIDRFPSHFNLEKEYESEFFTLCDYFKNYLHNNMLTSSVLASSNTLPKMPANNASKNYIFNTKSNIHRQIKGRHITHQSSNWHYNYQTS